MVAEVGLRGQSARTGGRISTVDFDKHVLVDGDEVVITARSNGSGVPIGFGEVRGRVLPARS